MAGILDTVDQRTQLVGENRLELLMFHLGGMQKFAINVFKIQEVLRVPHLTAMPHRHPHVEGVANIRGQTLPVINMSQAVGMRPIELSDKCNLIVAEYNRSVQAFLVGEVDRIVNLNWDEVLPPPKGAGRAHYLTAITRQDDCLVEIIDVEKVLAEIVPYSTDISQDVLDEEACSKAQGLEVILVDDSTVGLSQARSTIEQLGLTVRTETDGLRGLNLIRRLFDEDPDYHEKLLMVVTDAEMPEMDGYRLTKELRADPRFKDLFIVLHTSLSGSFNKAMVQKVGCDDLLSKFQPDTLAKVVQERIKVFRQ